MPNDESVEQSLNIASDQSVVLPLPELLEASIARGIERGIAERKRTRQSSYIRMGSAMAACMLFVACLFTIRLSPAFASFVKDIPGMETFVNLIRNSSDRGIGLALDNDFVQPLAVSDEYGGIRLTVEGVLADDGRVVIFYTIENRLNDEVVTMGTPKLADLEGESLNAIVSFGHVGKQDEKQPKGIDRGTIDIQMADGRSLPDRIVLKLGLHQSGQDEPWSAIGDAPDPYATEPSASVIRENRPNDHEYSVTIPIDKAKFAGMKQEYALNQTITIDGQRITFVKATVNPLQVMVEVAYDENNGKQIFGSGDIRMTDETGEVWKSFWSMGRSKDRAIIGFESSYFHKPKELYIEGEMFRALDKEKMDVVVDINQGKLLHAPDDLLEYKGMTSYGKYRKLTFTLQVDHAKDNMAYGGIFEGKFKDASGKEHEMATISGGVTSSMMESGGMTQNNYYYLDDTDYEQPLTFRVSGYPNYIRHPYKIRIK